MVGGAGRGASLVIADLNERYGAEAAPPAMARLYEDDSELGHVLAVLQGSLNRHFDAINGRAKSTRHYWAEDSRELLALIPEVFQILHSLRRAGVDVALNEQYQRTMEECERWLSPSGGSQVPEDFPLIDVQRYEAVFTRGAGSIELAKGSFAPSLKMVGEGSYALVYSFVDPDYDKTFALKRAKSSIGERDLERFRQEFEVMKRLSFPYILEVYQFNEERNEYRMEYCEETLRSYVNKRNSTALSFGSRKRIALQLLYAVNYLHSQNLLHRDLSLQNVLLKVYGSGAVLVKLSDFGLVKDDASPMTRTHTEMKGTIRDPVLHSMKDFTVLHEIYAIGFLVSFVFTGKESLTTDGDVGRIAKKCTAPELNQRYQSVREIITDVERLEALPTDSPA